MKVALRPALPLALALTVLRCGPGGVEGEDQATDPLIVGALEWTETSALDPTSAERARARAVGYLSLPAKGARCTAFLITEDVVMTNHHCVPDADAARGATVDFDRELGVPAAQRTRYACAQLLGNDAALDYALLACDGRPGASRGVLPLQPEAATKGRALYVLQQNCDYYRDPSCEPTKKLSRGVLTAVGSRLGHDADTLGGSSGSPVLDAETHQVIGLHNVGIGGDGAGRGIENGAVPMTRILPALAARFPPPSEPELYEPNETPGAAPVVALPLDVQDGLRIADDADVDYFAFDTDGAPRSITLTFVHAAGDLDMALEDAAGRGVAQSAGVTDVEALEVTLPAGRYFVRVVGWSGATNAYALSIR